MLKRKLKIITTKRRETDGETETDFGSFYGKAVACREAGVFVCFPGRSGGRTSGKGTGTVDKDGNAGAIGGIYQKVIAANLNKADIFFVPVSSMDYEIYSKESNYLEALESYQKLIEKNVIEIAPLAYMILLNI